MKITITKKENDENIYFEFDKNEKILNFENIKGISVSMLDKKIKGETTEYEIITTDSSLNLYKSTLKNIIDNVINDEELIKLYKSKKI